MKQSSCLLHAVAAMVVFCNAAGVSTAQPHSINNPPETPATVQLKGPAQIVFGSARDHCGSGYTMDTPARAFRDAKGDVVLIAGDPTNFRLVGRSLNAISPGSRDCSPIFTSANDRTYEHGRYHEWISSTYTTDGKKVYGLVHNEWYANLVGSPCEDTKAWLNFITLVESNDGGARFSHPKNYIVMKPARPWSSDLKCGTTYGAFEPTNFIKKDDYYYAMFRSGSDPSHHSKTGVCIVRTPDIADPNAYQVWTGKWTSASSTYCEPLQHDILEHMHGSITYNTYLRTYVLVGFKYQPAPGVYLSTSQDLLSWSIPIKILPREVDLSGSNRILGTGKLNYPSLLDPTDTSRNFENTGQDPYLYFVYDNGKQRYMIRQQIHLSAR